MKSFMILILYIVVGLVLSTVDIGVTTWQYWVIIASVVGIDTLSFIKGLK